MKRVPLDEAMSWKKMYEEDGMSIEEISLEVYRDRTTVRTWLLKVGTQMRPSSAQRTRRHIETDGVKKARQSIPKASTRKSFSGHRRRGKGW